MKKSIIKIIITLIIFLIALLVPFQLKIVNNILFIIAYIIIGIEIVIEAIKNIFKGEILDENFLMTVATIGAFLIGEYPEAVAVMLFYEIGELFQEYAIDKSKKSITSLMNIRPDFANIYKDGNLIKVNPEEIKIGDEIVIKPGEKVPLDGIITEGSSMFDTSALTGESVPRNAKIGDVILSGFINQNGLIKIKVTKEFSESTVSKILDLVENASNKKSKSENFITKFARYYTPIVVILAIILAIVPPLFLPDYEFSKWIYRALSFLVVSCPCALVLSIPLSFFGGIGGASRKGILIKGGNYLEQLANIKSIVLDKTGTLTKGVFEVQKIYSKNYGEQKLLEMVAYAENFSSHPIALSIKKAYKKEIVSSKITENKEISGLGIESLVDGNKILVGNDKLMQKYNIEFEKCNEIGTILYIAINNKFEGYILISDKIKEDAISFIEDLKKNNIKQTIMLTGDKKEIGEYVANELKLDKVYTELLPNEKVERLEELIKDSASNEKIAFVGDGINDAPVLAIADIGIAMGALGTDAAIEAADIVIMTDELSKIVTAIKISKKTKRIVKQNIYFAIGVKILVLILSALGITNMWAAVFADVGVSIIAVLNALRLLK